MLATETLCECGSDRPVYDYQRGEVVCENCGLVNGGIIDDGHPVTMRNDNYVGSEGCGPPQKTGARRLMTRITGTRDANGHRVDSQRTYRLMQAQSRAVYRVERSEVQERIVQISSQLEVPRIATDRAVVIANQARKTGRFRGIPFTTLGAGALYVACRDLRVPRTLNDFAKVIGRGRRGRSTVYKTSTKICRALKLGLIPATPEQFLPKIASDLGLDATTQKRAMQILTTMSQTGGSPLGAVAAAVYLAAEFSQKVVARAAGVSEVTLRSRLKEME